MIVPDVDAMKQKRSYELMVCEPEPVSNTGKIKTAACEVVCGLHLAAAIPDMSEFDKGYLLGKGETIADMRRAEKKETEVVKA